TLRAVHIPGKQVMDLRAVALTLLRWRPSLPGPDTRMSSPRCQLPTVDGEARSSARQREPPMPATCTPAKTSLLTFASIFFLSGAAIAAEPSRPNILWLTSEDHGPHMGCYGDTYATTPNVDRLAARGMIYLHAWSCAPVCAPARTTIIS